MKFIVTSDSHKEGKNIKKVVEFAKENDIKTIFDAGDLHGEIQCYRDIENLHAVYWDEACGAMERWNFQNEIDSIDATMHENGSSFQFENLAVFMQHNLAGYQTDIPEEKKQMAKSELDLLAEGKDLQKFVFFGHTHNPHLTIEDGVTFINPGSLSMEDQTFAIVDTETKEIEYRTQDEEKSLKISPESDIIHIRSFSSDRYNDFSFDKYIARLKSGNEVLIKDGERSEEYKRIISVSDSKEPRLHIETEDELHQIIEGEFRSKTFEKIKIVNSEFSDKFYGYIGVEDGKETLFIGKEEVQSPFFDKISETTPITENGLTYFVAQEKIDEEKTNDFVVTMDSNGKIQQGTKYDEISEFNLRDGKVTYKAITKDSEIIVADEEEIFKAKIISDFDFIDGKLIYRKDYDDPICLEDGTELKGYDYVFQVKNAYKEGKLQLDKKETLKKVMVYVSEKIKPALEKTLGILVDSENLVVTSDFKAELQKEKYDVIIDTTNGVVAHDMKYMDIEHKPEIETINDKDNLKIQELLEIANKYTKFFKI